MPTPLLILGAGGQGRETLDVVEACNEHAPTWDVLGFVADAEGDDRLLRRGARVIAKTDELADLVQRHHAMYHLALGTSAARARFDAAMVAAGLADRAATLVHPLASIGSDTRFEPGVYLAQGARVTTNVVLGRHTHLNVNAVVSHDCVVGDHVTLSPGVMINGTVTIGDRTFLGTGAIVLPGRVIGPDAVIGAGAVINRDVPAGARAVGVPARWD